MVSIDLHASHFNLFLTRDFTSPRVLIFDEATSALDDESEVFSQRNMGLIVKGRIIEAGTHDELVQRPKGLYDYLWRMQQQGVMHS